MNAVILLVEDNPSDEKLTRLAFKTCGIRCAAQGGPPIARRGRAISPRMAA